MQLLMDRIEKGFQKPSIGKVEDPSSTVSFSKTQTLLSTKSNLPLRIQSRMLRLKSIPMSVLCHTSQEQN